MVRAPAPLTATIVYGEPRANQAGGATSLDRATIVTRMVTDGGLGDAKERMGFPD